MNPSLRQNTSTIWRNRAAPSGIASAIFNRAMVERSYQRFPASLPGAVMAYDGPHVIRSVDLSRNGCRIQNTVQLVPGMTIDLLLFPGDDVPIVIQGAKVRWSGAEGIGIEFQTIEFHHLHRLDLLINQLKKPH